MTNRELQAASDVAALMPPAGPAAAASHAQVWDAAAVLRASSRAVVFGMNPTLCLEMPRFAGGICWIVTAEMHLELTFPNPRNTRISVMPNRQRLVFPCWRYPYLKCRGAHAHWHVIVVAMMAYPPLSSRHAPPPPLVLWFEKRPWVMLTSTVGVAV